MPEPRPIAELRQLHEDARTCLASLAIEGAHAKTLIDYYAAVARALPALLDCAEALALVAESPWCENDYGACQCIDCGGVEPNHEADCKMTASLAALAAAGWEVVT